MDGWSLVWSGNTLETGFRYGALKW